MVVGFPLLTALALRHITSAHSIVFVGLLPLATAVLPCCVGRTPAARLLVLFLPGQRPVAGFSLSNSLASGLGASLAGDL